jgi:D-alanyl-D-alanine carboxypeptidase
VSITRTLTALPWLWTSYLNLPESGEVSNQDQYRLTFAEDGTLTIKADCNTAAGSYAVAGDGAVSIQLGPVTMAACATESLSDKMLKALGQAGALNVSQTPQGPVLVVTTGSGILLFAPAFPNAIDQCGDKAKAINTVETVESTLGISVTAQLDEMLLSLLHGGVRAAPGVAFFIDTPQGRYFKSTGVSDVKTCAPLIANSHYQIGSNTKMMTAAMIFQLQEEGKLSTTDLLSKWLPEWAAKIPNGDKITLDMLLTHTSGIYDYIDGASGDGPLAAIVRDRDLLVKSFTPEELVQLAIDNGKPISAPGTGFHYSNTGYVLLGMIIEKLTGLSYDENLKARVFEPLGLKNTYLQAGQPEPLALPQGYTSLPFDYTSGEWNASQGWAAGAVVSTPEDFAAFLKGLFTGKLFKNADTLALMLANNKAGVNALGPGMTYGHGMMNNNGVLGHGGQTPGFQSDGGYIPDKDVTMVFWSNSSENNVNRTLVPAVAQVIADSGQ